LQSRFPSAATIVVLPNLAAPLALSEPEGMRYVGECEATRPHQHEGVSVVPAADVELGAVTAVSDVTDLSSAFEKTTVVIRAVHVSICHDPEEVQFKLYDVRPLALSRANEGDKLPVGASS
jgi:hypothetical protein